jgi:hypothetical protein
MPNAGVDHCRQDCQQLNRSGQLGGRCDLDVALARQVAARVSWRVLMVLIVVLRRHSIVRVFARSTRLRVNWSGQNTAVLSRLILNATAAGRDIWQPGNSQQNGDRPATTGSSERRTHTLAIPPIHGYGFVVTAILILDTRARGNGVSPESYARSSTGPPALSGTCRASGRAVLRQR